MTNNTIITPGGVEVEVRAKLKLCPATLACLFWRMDADEQAQFFNALGNEDEQAFNMQMYSAGQSDRLTLDGREVLRALGEAY